jgi:phosphoenolpyruvate synthase/pyruvate phosphate dikinase
MKTIILLFDRINIKELSCAGKKKASLGEMIKNLSPLGVRVSPGFPITEEAFREFLSFNKLTVPIIDIIQKLNRKTLDKQISRLVREAHAVGVKVGLYGLAACNHQQFAIFLVQYGIDSISLNPDTLLEGIENIAAAEKTWHHSFGHCTG